MTCRRVVILGLDGMPYRLVRSLCENGTMPNTRRLVDRGEFRQMASSIPEISCVAWSSIITGANPAEHGIFGFTDLAQSTYRLCFPNFASLRRPTFWMRDQGRRCVIVNVPATYPARELNGVLIAGFVALDLDRAVHPVSLLPILKELDYRVDVNYQRADLGVDYFLRDLNRTLDARTATYRHLWSQERWDTFMLVFTGVDRLAHFLWHAYEDPAHEHHGAFVEHLARIDDVVGEIAGQLRDDDVLIMLSDHGFELMEKDVHINWLLEQEGLLSFTKSHPVQYRDMDESTTAFALDPARIHVHLRGKYPRGAVHPADHEGIVRDVEEMLAALAIEGRRVLRRVYRKEEVFKGPLLEHAPDLVAVADTGFNLRPGLNADSLWSKSARSGKHSQHDAFLLVHGDGAEEIVPAAPSVGDVLPIIEHLIRRE